MSRGRIPPGTPGAQAPTHFVRGGACASVLGHAAMSGDSPVPAPGGLPTLHFPPELPISSRVEDITAAITAHQVVIVAGATGSGKTTQLPKVLLALGRGRPRQIGVTQPRRIAATSVAARVAHELGTELGTDVGYQIRFEDRSSRQTAVKFMTDGVLLAQIHSDPLLSRYDTLVLDEAHERSLTIDFLLGWLKRLLPRRPDLKVVVSSATLETERFSRFFEGAPVIQVEGRTFPVDVLYEPPPEDAELADSVADAVADVLSLDPDGDVLVFLPGEREIREAEKALNARELRGTVVQPLYASLSAAEQSRVFATLPERRVILATNVAETSVTLPGIVYVVDTGVARLSRYEPRSGTTRPLPRPAPAEGHRRGLAGARRARGHRGQGAHLDAARVPARALPGGPAHRADDSRRRRVRVPGRGAHRRRGAQPAGSARAATGARAEGGRAAPALP
jgi:ATP-dependent helicase HrpA